MAGFMDFIANKIDGKFGAPTVELATSGAPLSGMVGRQADSKDRRVVEKADLRSDSIAQQQRERAAAAKAQIEARKAMEESRKAREASRQSMNDKNSTQNSNARQDISKTSPKPNGTVRGFNIPENLTPASNSQSSGRPGSMVRNNENSESAEINARRNMSRNKSPIAVAAERAELEFNAAKNRESRAVQEAVDAAARAEEARQAVIKSEEMRVAAEKADEEAGVAAKAAEDEYNAAVEAAKEAQAAANEAEQVARAAMKKANEAIRFASQKKTEQDAK